MRGNSLLCFYAITFPILTFHAQTTSQMKFTFRHEQQTAYGNIWPHTFNFISVDYLTHKEFFSNYLDSPTRLLNIRGGTIILLPVLRPKYTFVLPELIQLKFTMQIQDLKKLEQTQIWCQLNRVAELKEELIWPNYFNVNLLFLKVTAFVIALYLS